MSTRLVIDQSNELKELRESDFPNQPASIRVAASLFSYIFHPVFIPVYVTIFLVYLHPYFFIGFTPQRKLLVVIQAVLMYSFFPIVTVLLLKALKFIQSVYLSTQKDRIIPLVICGIWYFWVWYVWRNLDDYPREIVVFAMATFLGSSIGLMMNIYMKVSLHAISVGVVLGFMFWLGFSQNINAGIYISATLLVAGIVCSSRLIISDHSPKEIYGGLLAGMIAIPIANLFV